MLVMACSSDFLFLPGLQPQPQPARHCGPAVWAPCAHRAGGLRGDLRQVGPPSPPPLGRPLLQSPPLVCCPEMPHLIAPEQLKST